MDREQLIRSLRRYAGDRELPFKVDKKKGKGSHYRVKLDARTTTIQKNLNPGRIARILKQLGVDPADL